VSTQSAALAAAVAAAAVAAVAAAAATAAHRVSSAQPLVLDLGPGVKETNNNCHEGAHPRTCIVCLSYNLSDSEEYLYLFKMH